MSYFPIFIIGGCSLLIIGERKRICKEGQHIFLRLKLGTGITYLSCRLQSWDIYFLIKIFHMINIIKGVLLTIRSLFKCMCVEVCNNIFRWKVGEKGEVIFQNSSRPITNNEWPTRYLHILRITSKLTPAHYWLYLSCNIKIIFRCSLIKWILRGVLLHDYRSWKAVQLHVKHVYQK